VKNKGKKKSVKIQTSFTGENLNNYSGLELNYKSTGGTATSPLICYIDFGSDKVSSAGNFTITWDAEGILNLG
jgi:hypothetical protein